MCQKVDCKKCGKATWVHEQLEVKVVHSVVSGRIVHYRQWVLFTQQAIPLHSHLLCLFSKSDFVFITLISQLAGMWYAWWVLLHVVQGESIDYLYHTNIPFNWIQCTVLYMESAKTIDVQTGKEECTSHAMMPVNQPMKRNEWWSKECGLWFM